MYFSLSFFFYDKAMKNIYNCQNYYTITLIRRDQLDNFIT